MQRVSDTWRSVHGSSAMSIIAAFFKSNPKIDSDEARQNFARLALENSKFLYSNSDGDDPEVCMHNHDILYDIY